MSKKNYTGFVFFFFRIFHYTYILFNNTKSTSSTWGSLILNQLICAVKLHFNYSFINNGRKTEIFTQRRFPAIFVLVFFFFAYNSIKIAVETCHFYWIILYCPVLDVINSVLFTAIWNYRVFSVFIWFNVDLIFWPLKNVRKFL